MDRVECVFASDGTCIGQCSSGNARTCQFDGVKDCVCTCGFNFKGNCVGWCPAADSTYKYDDKSSNCICVASIEEKNEPGSVDPPLPSYFSVMSYNLSLATQSNDLRGTEYDFVQACQAAHTSSTVCTTLMAEWLNKDNIHPTLIGIQETVRPQTDNFINALGNYDIYQSSVTNRATVVVAADRSSVGLGKVIHDKGWAGEGRSRIAVYFKDHNILAICNHFPHNWTTKIYTQRLNKYSRILERILNKMNINWKTLNIFFMGDFNDHKYQLISRNSKNQFIKFLNTTLYVDDGDNAYPNTCCYPNYEFKSDYILSSKKPTYFGRIISDVGGYKRRINEDPPMGSDHDPVIAFYD